MKVEQLQGEQELDAFYEWWHMRPSLTRLQAWLIWKDEHKQPPCQPLTDEAERQCPYPKANPSTRDAWLDGWEAAEREHGIGGEA